jgi:nucleoside-diphosphate-sugar epimerase
VARVAVTGATGFLGRHLVRALAEQGDAVAILARRPPAEPLWPGAAVTVVEGALDRPDALQRLCDGADVVVHGAGLIKARSRAEFFEANVRGSERLARACGAAPMVMVSSLAAREPQLSHYAASKRGGEDAARAVLGDRLTVARPPAIYGPGDVETFALFKAVAKGPVAPLLHPAARVAMIHVADAARQIAAMARAPAPGAVFTLSDARPDGYRWAEIVDAVCEAVGRSPPRLPIPGLAVHAAALVWERFGGRSGAPMVTVGKAREILHRDWSVPPEARWTAAPEPQFTLKSGFVDTVAWYRALGWL